MSATSPLIEQIDNGNWRSKEEADAVWAYNSADCSMTSAARLSPSIDGDDQGATNQDGAIDLTGVVDTRSVPVLRI